MQVDKKQGGLEMKIPINNNDASHVKEEINLSEYKESKGWSTFLETNFGILSAIHYAAGSDLLLDALEYEMHELSRMPIRSHVGQINSSVLKDNLPQQFMTRYDYDFLYKFRSELIDMRLRAMDGLSIIAHSVAQELIIYISNDMGKIATESDENVKKLITDHKLIYDKLSFEMDDEDLDEMKFYDEDWVFTLFGDADILSELYSGRAVAKGNSYHIKHWFDEQFFAIVE